MREDRDAVVTGIGLISSAGEGVQSTLDCLTGNADGWPRADTQSCAPYMIMPMVELDLSRQIERRGEMRQMGQWQRYGVYAAGLALDDAGIKDEPDLLGRTNLIVAAGGGGRDEAADDVIVEAARTSNDPGPAMNRSFMTDLRPTLFLAQLSNLLAGNISIVHKVTGSSRTFMGDELCGGMALQVATRRIQAGQGDLFLVGSGFNSRRPDVLLGLELADLLWTGGPGLGIWGRVAEGGGVVLGSMAAFLVLEAADHAAARGAKSYARLDVVAAETGRRDDDALVARRLTSLADAINGTGAGGSAYWISGASGVVQAAAMERDLIERIDGGGDMAVRSYGSVVGHGLPAQMPFGVALAAALLGEQRNLPPLDPVGPEQPTDDNPDRAIVCCVSHWRGEAVAVLSRG